MANRMTIPTSGVDANAMQEAVNKLQEGIAEFERVWDLAQRDRTPGPDDTVFENKSSWGPVPTARGAEFYTILFGIRTHLADTTFRTNLNDIDQGG